LPPVQRLTLDDRIHAHLRSLIVEGHVRAGERIQVDALAASLHASRARVLNALKRLAREGAVDWLSRRGIYVRLLSAREMAELLAVREMLEGLAARLAAGRATKAELARLAAMFTRFSGATTPALVERYVRADRAFHRRLVVIARNEHLTRAVEAINTVFFAYREGLVRSLTESVPEHLAILRALCDRDPDASEAAMRLHLRRSAEHLARSVRDRDPRTREAYSEKARG
jgi:DNA-binding GntR family transcriptional regulator